MPLLRGLPFAFCPCMNPKGRGAPLRVWVRPPVRLPLWQVHRGWGVLLPRSLHLDVTLTHKQGRGGATPGSPSLLVCWACRQGGTPSLLCPPSFARCTSMQMGVGRKRARGGGPKGGRGATWAPIHGDTKRGVPLPLSQPPPVAPPLISMPPCSVHVVNGGRGRGCT